MAIDIKLPDWFQDPLYQKSQDIMLPFGQNLMSGNIPDYYKPIGEYGGDEFENILGLITRDTTNAVNENLVRRNMTRGGIGTTAIAKSVADTSKNLRWSDYLRALTGRENLMNTGLSTIGGVRSSALDLTGQKNSFNLNRSNLEFNVAKTNEELEAQKEAQKNSMWQSILSSAIGAVGSFTGAGMISNAIKSIPGTSMGSAGGGASSLLSKIQGRKVGFGGLTLGM